MPFWRLCKITLRTEPNPAKGSQENTFHFSVTDANRKRVSDGNVRITFVMPAMPEMNMAEMKVMPTVAWNGSNYSGKANIPPSGLWNVTLQVLKADTLVQIGLSAAGVELCYGWH